MTAANGGGGFLLVFLISTILIGFPLLLAEFALGRSAGVSAIKTFGKLGKNSKYNFIGWIGAFALFYPFIVLQCYWRMDFSLSRSLSLGNCSSLVERVIMLSYLLQSFQIQPLP